MFATGKRCSHSQPRHVSVVQVRSKVDGYFHELSAALQSRHEQLVLELDRLSEHKLGR